MSENVTYTVPQTAVQKQGKKKKRGKNLLERFSRHFITYLAFVVLLGIGVYLNMTLKDIIEAIIHISPAIVLMGLAFDYSVDFSKLYKKLDRKLPDGAGIGSFVLISAFFFFVFLTSMGYSITALSTGGIAAGVVFVAALFGVLIALPKTGTSLTILKIYLAAWTVALLL